MSFTIAISEAIALALLLAGPFLLWSDPAAGQWTGVAQVAGRAALPVFCTIVAYYYADLYDLRLTHTFRAFCSRLPVAVLIALALATIGGAVLPGPGLTLEALRSDVTFVLLLASASAPLRWGLYTLLDHSSFTQRVLILGTGPLARKLAEEITTSTGGAYSVLGFLDDSDADRSE